MKELFYNFTLNGENCGYSYLFLDSSRLHSFTRFLLDSDEVFTNVFKLKLSDEEIIACKHGDLDWIDLNGQPLNHIPGCAYPLILPRAMTKPYTYVQISEDDASVIGEIHLQKIFDDIVESQNGAVCRTFTMKGRTPVRIDWGGAVSHLCSDGDESVRGTGLSFVVE